MKKTRLRRLIYTLAVTAGLVASYAEPAPAGSMATANRCTPPGECHPLRVPGRLRCATTAGKRLARLDQPIQPRGAGSCSDVDHPSSICARTGVL